MSILVEEDPYLWEVVCSSHLNPLRAGRVTDLAALDAYPWTGHSALGGRMSGSWQAGDEGLAESGVLARDARWGSRTVVNEGIERGRRPELQDGGLRRRAGG